MSSQTTSSRTSEKQEGQTRGSQTAWTLAAQDSKSLLSVVACMLEETQVDALASWSLAIVTIIFWNPTEMKSKS